MRGRPAVSWLSQDDASEEASLRRAKGSLMPKTYVPPKVEEITVTAPDLSGYENFFRGGYIQTPDIFEPQDQETLDQVRTDIVEELKKTNENIEEIVVRAKEGSLTQRDLDYLRIISELVYRGLDVGDWIEEELGPDWKRIEKDITPSDEDLGWDQAYQIVTGK